MFHFRFVHHLLPKEKFGSKKFCSVKNSVAPEGVFMRRENLREKIPPLFVLSCGHEGRGGKRKKENQLHLFDLFMCRHFDVHSGALWPLP